MIHHAQLPIAIALLIGAAACTTVLGVDKDYVPGVGGGGQGGTGGQGGAGMAGAGGSGGGLLDDGSPCTDPNQCQSGKCEAGECCSNNCQ